MEEEAIDEGQLADALRRQEATGERLGEALVAMGALNARKLAPHLEASTGFPFADIGEIEIDPHVAALVPETYATAHRLVVVRADESGVTVAMADPLDVATIDDLKARIGRPIRPVLALSPDIRQAVQRAYDPRLKARSVIEEIGQVSVVEDHTESLAEQASDAPIVRLLNNILSAAFAAEASDVHLEPRADAVHVRFRIDGLLFDQMTVPAGHHATMISRLKIMAGLDIAENRRPLDGRFAARDEHGNEYDIRLSVIPTVHGQKACLRLLEKTGAISSLEQLGFDPGQRRQFEGLLKRPHGLILVTGPTGSGKTTTLYSGLQFISDPTLNINTIEDPVEYDLPAANQVQVNPKIGLTFSAGLRSLLRQDPDVILIGEIRDRETAEIAIQAAMTGHLVLSTLHTNDAPSALVRLQNMGIEPYLISSSLVGVLGQRLLRKVCPYCRETYEATPDVLLALGLDPAPGARLARGSGCRRCGGRGMRGRLAAYELLTVSDRLRDMVLAGAAGPDLARQANEEGLVTMRQAACRKVLDQVTTPEEVLRVFSSGEERL